MDSAFSKVLFLFFRRMRAPLIVLISAYAVSVIGLVLIPGVDEAGNPWRFDFFHAFYFVSFMGSTIGFGEIPHAFTPGQRLWVSACIFFSVISWLYAIGRIFSLTQDPAFTRATTEARFIRSVRKIGQPFTIVCGYGETGSLRAGLSADVLIVDGNPLRDLGALGKPRAVYARGERVV